MERRGSVERAGQCGEGGAVRTVIGTYMCRNDR